MGAVVQDRGDNIRAKPYFVESLTLFQDLGNNWYIAHCLQQLAAVMITEEYPQRAAHLCAAAQALREAINAPLWPSARAHYEQIVSSARATRPGSFCYNLGGWAHYAARPNRCLCAAGRGMIRPGLLCSANLPLFPHTTSVTNMQLGTS
jgi:hypothetical protein